MENQIKKYAKSIFILGAVFVISGCSFGQKQEKYYSDQMNFEKKPQATQSPSQNNNSNKNNPMENQTQEKDASYAEKYSFALIKTNFGNIKVEFFNQEAPQTVNNFLKLADEGFYDKTKFHRVIDDFMIQGGDPNSKDDDPTNDGMGGPGYTFEDEFGSEKLVRGSLAMANSGPNTNGSQFFIVTADETPWLDGKHTNFGKVIEGMDVVEKIEKTKTDQRDYPIENIVIEGIELIEK